MTAARTHSQHRLAEGLYDPAFEHDSCGVAFVATLTGIPSNAIVRPGAGGVTQPGPSRGGRIRSEDR